MKFDYSSYSQEHQRTWVTRLAAILPGFLSWSILLGIILLCVFWPLGAVVAIIVLNFYWMLRLTYMTFFLLLSYSRLSLEKKADWNARIRALDIWRKTGVIQYTPEVSRGMMRWISSKIHRAEVETLQQSGALIPDPSEILHLVIIPMMSEDEKVVEPGIRSILSGDYPARQIMIILAVEQRAEEKVKKAAAFLQEKYRPCFFEMFCVEHPGGVPGEAKVKGANVTHAAKFAEDYFKKKAISHDRVLVSCFDADTIASGAYFSCLTYAFMVCPKRHRASFQPMPVFNNNIWEVPSFARVLEMGASFLQLTEATNSERLVTFSSHSMSFKALVEVGYWPVDMISDDSAIFWKSFIHYDGDYRVVPMYTTVSMDAACAENRWATMKNIYKQKRRWAWGIENFPIVIRGFLQNNDFSILTKLAYSFKCLEVHISWATCPFILAFIGGVPFLLSGGELSNSVLYFNAPRITNTLFNLASVSLVITILLSLALLPDVKIRFPVLRRIRHAFEWLLIPVIAIFFSAIPALEAQTRLMLGLRMEFYNTKKSKAL